MPDNFNRQWANDVMLFCLELAVNNIIANCNFKITPVRTDLLILIFDLLTSKRQRIDSRASTPCETESHYSY